MADISAVEVTPDTLKYYVEGKKLPYLIEKHESLDIGGAYKQPKYVWYCYKATSKTTKSPALFEGNKTECIRYIKRLIKSM